jgi:hypothetical protein
MGNATSPALPPAFVAGRAVAEDTSAADIEVLVLFLVAAPNGPDAAARVARVTRDSATLPCEGNSLGMSRLCDRLQDGFPPPLEQKLENVAVSPVLHLALSLMCPQLAYAKTRLIGMAKCARSRPTLLRLLRLPWRLWVELITTGTIVEDFPKVAAGKEIPKTIDAVVQYFAQTCSNPLMR